MTFSTELCSVLQYKKLMNMHSKQRTEMKMNSKQTAEAVATYKTPGLIPLIVLILMLLVLMAATEVYLPELRFKVWTASMVIAILSCLSFIGHQHQKDIKN